MLHSDCTVIRQWRCSNCWQLPAAWWLDSWSTVQSNAMACSTVTWQLINCVVEFDINCVVTVLPAVNNSDYTVAVQSLCSHCAAWISDGIGVLLYMILSWRQMPKSLTCPVLDYRFIANSKISHILSIWGLKEGEMYPPVLLFLPLFNPTMHQICDFFTICNKPSYQRS